MKTFIAALGALTLATSVAQAAPVARSAHPASTSVERTYQVAGWHERSDRDGTVNRATNQGAGTSRSNDANQG